MNYSLQRGIICIINVFCQNAYILFVLGDLEEQTILSAYWIAKQIKYIQEFYVTIEFIQNKDKIVNFPSTYISVFILQYTSPLSLFITKLSETPSPTRRPLLAIESYSTHYNNRLSFKP